MRRRVLPGAALLCAAAAFAAAQSPGRIATTAHVLAANALFFHGKQIVVRHAVTQSGDTTQLDGTSKPIFVYWKERPTRSEGEIRGEFWDLGRLVEGDGRLSAYDFRPVIEAASNGRWPGRERLFVILGATMMESPPPSAPTIRSIALAPELFDDRKVTLVGRFKGRNLYGDVPQGVAKSKWDFVLHSADAAVWITGLRPKGKDFDLDPGARVDTGRWLEVTGTVHRDGPTLWIAGESLRLTTAPAETPVEITVPSIAKDAPPAVIFSAPLAGETDVPLTARIRIQFSRDMNAGSFHDRVRIRYTGPNAPAPPGFTLAYNDLPRSLDVRFQQPLARFQTVTVMLLEGITAIDGLPLPPWSMSIITGG